MNSIVQGLFTNYYETAAIIIFGIGFTTLLLDRNMIKKIIGFNFMDTGVYLFLASKGYVIGRVAPISFEGLKPATFENYINPIPAGLVLTGIVVSVSFSAYLLALAIRLYKAYHTLDLEKIIDMKNKEAEGNE